MTGPDPNTRLPKALQAPAPVVQPTAPVAPPQPAMQAAPAPAQAAPAPAPAPAQQAAPLTAPAELDLSSFLVDPSQAAALQPQQPQAPQPQTQPAPMDPSVAAAFTAFQGQMADQAKAMEAIVARVAPAPTPESTPALSFGDVETLTEEESKQFEASLPVINKLVKRVINEQVAPVVSEAFATRDQKLDQLGQTVRATSEQGFDTMITAVVPDYHQLQADPAFQAFLRQPVPMSGGLQVGHMMRDAVSKRDIGRAKAMFDEFRQSNAASPTVQPSAPQPVMPAPAAAFAAAPTSAPNPTTTDTTQAKPMLKWSERVKAGNSLVKMGGNATPEDHARLAQINDLYDTALAEGRVDFNA